MLYASTEKKIQQIIQEVKSVTDKLGTNIDPDIRKAVIALRLFDFTTSASCQGHTDHGEKFPWIDIDNELWNDQGHDGNDRQLDKFQDLLIAYQGNPNVDCRDIGIEYFGVFGAFRVYAKSIEQMNKFADYLVRRYDFCSSPELRPTRIYMEKREYQDLLEWSKENELG